MVYYPHALRLSATASRQRGLVRLVLAVAVVAVEIGIGAALVDARFLPLLAAFAALGGLALTYRFPLAAIGVALLFAASVFHDARFDVPFGPLSLHPTEVVLGALLVVALLRPRRKWWGGFAGGALAAFLGWLTLATVLAVAAGRVGATDALGWVRPFGLLAVFFVVVRLMPDEHRARQVLTVGAGVGAATGALAVLVGVTNGAESLLADPANTFITAGEGLGVIERVRFPGLALSYLLFWYAVARALASHGGRRWCWSLVVLANLAAVTISFNRNMWIGLILGLLLLLIGGGVLIRRRVGAVLALTAAGIAVLVLSGPEVSERSALTPLAERAGTIVTPQRATTDRSLRSRDPENRRAWKAVQGHLLTGIGVGVPWGSFVVDGLPNGGLKRTRQLYLHNQYLYLVVAGGAPALLAFLCFIGALLHAAWFGPQRRTELAACGVGFVMLLVSSVVMISFSTRNWTVAIGVVSGAVVALARAAPRRPEPDPAIRESAR